MEAWLPPLGFAPLIGAARSPLYTGQGIGGSGPSLGQLPPVVVVIVVVGAVGPRMIVDGTYLRPKCLFLQLSPRKRSSCLLLS